MNRYPLNHNAPSFKPAHTADVMAVRPQTTRILGEGNRRKPPPRPQLAFHILLLNLASQFYASTSSAAS